MTEESISKRFNRSFIKIVAFLLLAFALGVAIYGVNKMNSQLNDQLDYVSRLARISLQRAIWNMDDRAINEILSALFLDDDIVYLAVVSDGKITAKKNRAAFEKSEFNFFEKSSQFVSFSSPIVFEEEEIGTFQIAMSKAKLKKNLTAQVISIILLALLLILIITQRSIAITRKIIFKPLMELENSASAISGGNLDINIPHDSADEIGSLGKSFDGMRESLKKLITDLNEMNTELEQRVEERTLELIEAKDKAEAANTAKSQFLSSMSHELRTPLNSILGFSQLMETDTTEPLKITQKENIFEIQKSGRLLLELINEVLDLTKIESGKTSMSIENISIKQIIIEVFSLMEPMAEKHGITIINKTTMNEDIYVLVDFTRIKQVLINLISNAIKYNRQSGSVTVSIENSNEKTVRLSVEDTGKGIPEENLPFIFEPFNRLGAETLNIEGTGIGLTITKKLMKLMGGKIEAESEVGKGSRFLIDMKAAEKPDKKTTEQVSSRPQIEEKTGMKQTILYIEDNPANLKLVERILSRRPNIRLLFSPEAKSGIELAVDHKPDLILMDINLPGMNGYEALNELRALDETNKIPVIAVSANAMDHDVKRGKNAGFKDYITKPIDIKIFLEAVDNTLGKKDKQL